MKKIFSIILIGFVILLAVFIVARNVIIKTGLERGVEYATGLPLSIGAVNIGIKTPMIALKNIKLYNPREFSDRVMIDVPEVYIDYNLNDILKKNYHFHEIRLDLKELVVIRKKDGTVNLNALKPPQKETEKKEEKSTQPQEHAKMPQIQIDQLKLKMGRVIYKDYRQGSQVAVQEFLINTQEEFTNVNDLQGLVSLIVVRTLAKTSVAQLANFDMKTLETTVSKTLRGLKSVGTGTLNVLKNKLQNFKLPFKKE